MGRIRKGPSLRKAHLPEHPRQTARPPITCSPHPTLRQKVWAGGSDELFLKILLSETPPHALLPALTRTPRSRTKTAPHEQCKNINTSVNSYVRIDFKAFARCNRYHVARISEPDSSHTQSRGPNLAASFSANACYHDIPRSMS